MAVSTSTILRYDIAALLDLATLWQRRIPFVKVGRALRFEKHDLEKFIQSNRVEPRSEMK
jgi:hypothetical protein